MEVLTSTTLRSERLAAQVYDHDYDADDGMGQLRYNDTVKKDDSTDDEGNPGMDQYGRYPPLSSHAPSGPAHRFFFRQRRGHLNLRRLESLDLERLVREVDVDLLQQFVEDITFARLSEDDVHFLSDRSLVKLFRLSQLTIEYLLYSQTRLVSNLSDLSSKYSQKKRTLHRKRRELTALREEAGSLYAQLRAKRRNLSTLEKLVRDAGRTKAASAVPSVPTPPLNSSGFLKFTVAFGDGVFVDFEEAPETSIRRLSVLIRNVLDVGPNAINGSSGAINLETPIKLFHRGRLLLQESSLEACGIRDGDTLIATIVQPSPPVSAPAAPPTPVFVQAPPSTVIVGGNDRSQPEDNAAIKQMMDAVSAQLECMGRLTAEVNDWSAALKGAASNEIEKLARHETSLVDAIQKRLCEMESELKNTLVATGEDRVLYSRPRLVFGELENDREDNNSALHELSLRLQKSTNRLETLDTSTSMNIDELRAAMRRQSGQLDELRNLLMERSNVQMPQFGVIHYGMPTNTSIELSRQSRSDQNTQTYEEISHQVSEPPKTNSTPIPVPIPKIAVTTPEAKTNFEPTRRPEEFKSFTPAERKEPVLITPAEKDSPRMVASPVQQVVEEELDSGLVTITFPMSLNPDFSKYVHGLTSIKVVLSEESSADDCIFAIRKRASQVSGLPFGSVALLLRQTVLRLAVDAPIGAPALIPRVSQELARSGELSLIAQHANTISDAQLDVIVPAWERATSSSPHVASRDRSSRIASLGAKSAQRREFFESDDDVESTLFSSHSVRPTASSGRHYDSASATYKKVRGSLDSLLAFADQKDALSDSEASSLQRDLDYASSGASDSELTRSLRGSLADAAGLLTLDSNSVSGWYGPNSTGASLRLSTTGGGIATGSGNLTALGISAIGSDTSERSLRRSMRQFESEDDGDYRIIHSQGSQLEDLSFLTNGGGVNGIGYVEESRQEDYIPRVTSLPRHKEDESSLAGLSAMDVNRPSAAFDSDASYVSSTHSRFEMSSVAEAKSAPVDLPQRPTTSRGRIESKSDRNSTPEYNDYEYPPEMSPTLSPPILDKTGELDVSHKSSPNNRYSDFNTLTSTFSEFVGLDDTLNDEINPQVLADAYEAEARDTVENIGIRSGMESNFSDSLDSRKSEISIDSPFKNIHSHQDGKLSEEESRGLSPVQEIFDDLDNSFDLSDSGRH